MTADANASEPWQVPVCDAATVWGTDLAKGLAQCEVERRLAEFGRNELPVTRPRGPTARAAAQFTSPLIGVLLVAAVVTFLVHDYVDAGVILGVVVINAVIGFVQEGRAENALAAVRAMLASRANVVRDGERRHVDAAQLVPGDVVVLEAGDRVPADIRLVRVHNLRVEESALTGESVPADKTTAAIEGIVGLADRSCLAHSGTLVVVGQGRGVVVRTGRHTELGRIGELVSEAPDLDTPLTRRLDQFARQITVFIILVGLGGFLFAWYGNGMPPFDALLVVIGLTVAAIPEGLPAIITIVLAVGTQVMARNRAIVRRLPAVESLGSVSVICSDKTGTLTRNQMTAVSLMLPSGDVAVSGAGYEPDGGFLVAGAVVVPTESRPLMELVRAGVLCNDAVLHHDEEWSVAGDPSEGALVTLAAKAGLDRLELDEDLPRIDEIPFESERRYMATLHHDHHGHRFVVLKGAPERVLALCPQSDHREWRDRVAGAAARGLRLLAIAKAEVPEAVDALDTERLPESFQLLGMLGMEDPPRPEALDAVALCHGAGIRVVMITGDHARTAQAIAGELGLGPSPALTGSEIDRMDSDQLRYAAATRDVVARASPEHKMRLVAALQSDGRYVAMTGDGANDAPALKSADIGVAMGHRGTDAAREAADLVLADDNFATIAKAVRQGRVVYDNIKKSLLFILPTNGGEAGLLLAALVFGLTMPVTVGQILWVNMVTAVTLALALAFEPAEPGVMELPPRPPQQRLITKPLLARVALVSLLLAGLTLVAFEWELARGTLETARTTAVNVLVVGELAYLFNVRHFTASSLNLRSFVGNRVALAVVGILVALQLLFTYLPVMERVFRTASLGWESWVVIAGCGLAIYLFVEGEKAVLRRLGILRL